MGLLGEDSSVKANDGTLIPAKYLTYKGTYVYEADGTPYIVAADFNFENYVDRYRQYAWSLPNESEFGSGWGFHKMAVYNILLQNFPTGAPDDIQRNYNGRTYSDGNGFVAAFTPAASFVFGVACAILDIKDVEAEAGGGALNLKNRFYGQNGKGNSNVNINGFLGNNPNNIINIENGYRFANDNILGMEFSPPIVNDFRWA